jgi:hypothetical protein
VKLFVISVYFAILVAANGALAGSAVITFRTERAGYVSLNIYGPDGRLVCQRLCGIPFGAGDHEVTWNGLAGGARAAAGEYTWRAVFRGDLTLGPIGRIGDFGGDLGAPSAAAADELGVYLGWAGSSGDGDAVVACAADGTVRWTHHRGSLSGCKGLGTDAGFVYVLGGEGRDAEGRTFYRLNATDGTIAPWPDGRIDLPMVSLWPAKSHYKPERADCLAVKNGHVYLTFKAGKFIAVLDGKTGAYLQTIVGAGPEAMDAVETRSNTDEKPDQLIDADFLVTALKEGSIGKLLLAHDPIWVLAGEATQLDAGQTVAALAMIGDGAPHHMHDIFMAFGPPMDQVEARSALDTDTVKYRAGEVGGHPALGAWDRQKLSDVCGLALDGSGQLWVVEGDESPGRVSVWSTDERAGTLKREFFSPPRAGAPMAIDPADPSIVFDGACEWNLGREDGSPVCLGVVNREPLRDAHYVLDHGHVLLVLYRLLGGEEVTVRAGDGTHRHYPLPVPQENREKLRIDATPMGSWRISTLDGFDLGTIFNPLGSVPGAISFHEDAPGMVYIVAGRGRPWEMRLDGLETVRPLGSGKITIQ